MFYSKSTGGFYDREFHNVIPDDAVEITSEYRWEMMDGQSAGKVIAADADGFPFLQDPPPPPPPDPKWVGVEIDGVMCSATGTDQNGLMAVFMAYQLQGASYPGTVFSFENGNTLKINQDNIQEFIEKWVPFRQSFFKPE